METLKYILIAGSVIVKSMNDLTLWGLFCILAILRGIYLIVKANSNKTSVVKEIKILKYSKHRRKKKRG